jgi:membrane protein
MGVKRGQHLDCTLIGAELNAEMEHQTARDTTAGGEKPLGMRGAVMADRVGPAQS